MVDPLADEFDHGFATDYKSAERIFNSGVRGDHRVYGQKDFITVGTWFRGSDGKATTIDGVSAEMKVIDLRAEYSVQPILIDKTLDFLGKGADVFSGIAQGLTSAPDGSKIYLHTLKPSTSYGFRISLKTSFLSDVGTKSLKKINGVSNAIAVISVLNTYSQSDPYGKNTSLAVGKAIGGIIGGGIGGSLGTSLGAVAGVWGGPPGIIGTSVVLGAAGAYYGSEQGAKFGEWIVGGYFDLMN